MPNSPRPRFQLRTLGEPALLSIGDRTVRLRTKKELALLCYLAVETGWHTRDALAELLWPDRSHKESRHSLATALSALRGKLGREVLESDHERVRIRPGSLSLDVDRLLAGDIVGSDTEVPLDVDGFLEGFEVPDVVPFAHWRDGERARLMPHVLDALVLLLDRCRRRGDFRQIEHLALRLQRFEPLSEHAVRARMEARALSGDRLTALRLFEQWKAELARQLQAAPSDLVEGMAIRLRRRGWEQAGTPEVPTVHTDHWKDRPFVGRAREYRALYEAWELTQRCEPTHRLLLGDSGIGKSTLVDRMTTAAGLEGATVARVQCHEAEREIPYAMVSGLIAQLTDRPGASAAPPEALAELAQTIPEVRRRFPVLPPPLETHGDAARIRFTESTHALVTVLAEEHPVILVVDDVHHADDVSLAVLHRVIRLAERQAVLVIFLAREGELHQSPQASRLREQGASLGISQVNVAPLSREECGELLDGIILRGLPEVPLPVRRTLLTAAAGYPLVLELLVEDWAEGGEGSMVMALDAVIADPGRPKAPTDAYRLLVERLMAHLDLTTRRVLEVAAVLGPHLGEPNLYAAADLKMGEVMSGMSRLCDLRLLREQSGRVEFANDLVRGHVYMRVPTPVRHQLHSLFADALLQRAASGDESLDFAIAWHSMRSGRPAEATSHLLKGGRSAIQRGAVHEAELRLTSALGSLAGPQRTEASLLLAELLQEQGRFAESVGTLNRDQAALSSLHGGALLRMAELQPTTDSAEVLANVWGWTEPKLGNFHVSRNAARSLLRLAATLAYCGRDSDLPQRIQQALMRMPQEQWTGDDDIELRTQLTYVEYFAINPDDDMRTARENTLRQLIALLELSDYQNVANIRNVRLLAGVGLMHRGLGRYEQALPFLRHAFVLATRLEHAGRVATTSTHLATFGMETGDTAMQREYAERALKSAPDRRYKPLAEYLGAMALAASGDHRRALDLADQLASWARAVCDSEAQLALLHAADVYWVCSRQRSAYRAAIHAMAINNGMPLYRTVVGPLSRWAALLLRANPIHGGYGQQVLSGRFGAADLWDHAEVVAAKQEIARLLGQPIGGTPESLKTILAALPPAATAHLQRFDLA